MITLRIEHKTANYDGWKKAFDLDPINRKKSGVRHYRIFRGSDDENFIVIDLDFERLDEAKATLTALQKMWPKVEGSLIFGPKATILTVVESKDL